MKAIFVILSIIFSSCTSNNNDDNYRTLRDGVRKQLSAHNHILQHLDNYDRKQINLSLQFNNQQTKVNYATAAKSDLGKGKINYIYRYGNATVIDKEKLSNHLKDEYGFNLFFYQSGCISFSSHDELLESYNNEVELYMINKYGKNIIHEIQDKWINEKLAKMRNK